ncbi:hypothetical protein ILUMI_17139, partial [Ignelater luminosus]
MQHSIFKSIESLRWIDHDFTFDKDRLSPIITNEGLCYSFNLLDRNDLFTENAHIRYYEKAFISHQQQSNWTLENIFNKETAVECFPFHTTLAGSAGGFYIDLSISADDINYICGDTIQGFKVAVHHSGQIPNLDKGYFRVGLNQDVAVAVKPRAITTSNALRHYKPEKRKCYFEGEKTLKYFKIYDQQNCLMECLTNYTLAYCGCVGYFMPRKWIINQFMKVCELELVYCMEQANANFLTTGGNAKLPETKRNYDCTCFPSCTSLDFEIEISQSEWNWKAAEAEAASYQQSSFDENTLPPPSPLSTPLPPLSPSLSPPPPPPPLPRHPHPPVVPSAVPPPVLPRVPTLVPSAVHPRVPPPVLTPVPPAVPPPVPPPVR